MSDWKLGGIAHVVGHNRNRYAAINPYWLKIITRVGDLRAFIAIVSCADADSSIAFPSRDELADQTGMTKANVTRAIVNLEKLGAIRVERQRRRVNRYYIVSPAERKLRLAHIDGMSVELADGDEPMLRGCHPERLSDVREAWQALPQERALEIFGIRAMSHG